MAHRFTAMVDMAKSPAEAKEDAMPMALREPNRYPSGLCIFLDEDMLEKLDLDADELPNVGEMIHLCALAKVTAVSQTEQQSEGSEKKRCCRIELQITHLATENEDRENDWYDEGESEAA
jgi:hypothetical protein